MSDLLLFGISGNIGGEICDFFSAKGKKVVGVSRDISSSKRDCVECDILKGDLAQKLSGYKKFKAVCFSQGANLNDSIYDFNIESHLELYKANCLYIIYAIQTLIKSDLLEKGARICVISSIWQNIARQNKMSYCMTKAALQGLVNSLAVDLAKDGFLINAILPGALDTEMTRANLSSQQLEKLQSFTMFNRLANIKDVAALAYFLCSEDNTSITGQFINVDLGFENAKIV
jgi:3-oxoacyl-[acyl-carrier protein] reductase